MNNLNSVVIEGNLVRDPEYRTTAKGTSLCRFSLASSRYFKQGSEVEKEVSFFDTEAWGKLADHVSDKGHKGRGVRVVGRLKQDRWQNSEGKAQSKVVIVAEHVEFRPDFKNDSPAEEAAEAEEETGAAEQAENLVPTF